MSRQRDALAFPMKMLRLQGWVTCRRHGAQVDTGAGPAGPSRLRVLPAPWGWPVSAPAPALPLRRRGLPLHLCREEMRWWPLVFPLSQRFTSRLLSSVGTLL